MQGIFFRAEGSQLAQAGGCYFRGHKARCHSTVRICAWTGIALIISAFACVPFWLTLSLSIYLRDAAITPRSSSMEKVAAPSSAVPPTREPGRRVMRFAICVLVVSQFLPFYQGPASMEQRYTERGHGTYENAYADRGYESYVRSGSIDIGFAAHPYAIIILPVLIALFFTRLYRRPGWSQKIYWAAIILAIGCTELPPPIGSIGGMVGAIALALMAYSLYQRSQMQGAEVRAC